MHASTKALRATLCLVLCVAADRKQQGQRDVVETQSNFLAWASTSEARVGFMQRGTRAKVM